MKCSHTHCIYTVSAALTDFDTPHVIDTHLDTTSIDGIDLLSVSMCPALLWCKVRYEPRFSIAVIAHKGAYYYDESDVALRVK